MTLFLLNMSYDIIYYLRLFPQDQFGGLLPNGGRDQNCIYLYGNRGYHFDDAVCDLTLAALCEAPREALNITV